MIRYEIQMNDEENARNTKLTANGKQDSLLVEAIIFTKEIFDGIRKVEENEKVLLTLQLLYLEGVKRVLKGENFDVNDYEEHIRDVINLINGEADPEI